MLIDRYDDSTQVRAQPPARRTERRFEVNLISLIDNATIDNGIELSPGTELLYKSDIWVDDTGAPYQITNSESESVLIRDTGTKNRNLQLSLDASGNTMKSKKLVDINAHFFNSKTKKMMNITMVNCRFGGSKFNLCSLMKMTDSRWKMASDTTSIHLRRG